MGNDAEGVFDGSFVDVALKLSEMCGFVMGDLLRLEYHLLKFNNGFSAVFG